MQKKRALLEDLEEIRRSTNNPQTQHNLEEYSIYNNRGEPS